MTSFENEIRNAGYNASDMPLRPVNPIDLPDLIIRATGETEPITKFNYTLDPASGMMYYLFNTTPIDLPYYQDRFSNMSKMGGRELYGLLKALYNEVKNGAGWVPNNAYKWDAYALKNGNQYETWEEDPQQDTKIRKRSILSSIFGQGKPPNDYGYHHNMSRIAENGINGPFGWTDYEVAAALMPLLIYRDPKLYSEWMQAYDEDTEPRRTSDFNGGPMNMIPLDEIKRFVTRMGHAGELMARQAQISGEYNKALSDLRGEKKISSLPIFLADFSSDPKQVAYAKYRDFVTPARNESQFVADMARYMPLEDAKRLMVTSPATFGEGMFNRTLFSSRNETNPVTGLYYYGTGGVNLPKTLFTGKLLDNIPVKLHRSQAIGGGGNKGHEVWAHIFDNVYDSLKKMFPELDAETMEELYNKIISSQSGFNENDWQYHFTKDNSEVDDLIDGTYYKEMPEWTAKRRNLGSEMQAHYVGDMGNNFIVSFDPEGENKSSLVSQNDATDLMYGRKGIGTTLDERIDKRDKAIGEGQDRLMNEKMGTTFRPRKLF